MQKESDILKTIPEISLASMSCSPGPKFFDPSTFRQVQGTTDSGTARLMHRKLRGLPIPKFVESAVS